MKLNKQIRTNSIYTYNCKRPFKMLKVKENYIHCRQKLQKSRLAAKQLRTTNRSLLWLPCKKIEKASWKKYKDSIEPRTQLNMKAFITYLHHAQLTYRLTKRSKKSKNLHLKMRLDSSNSLMEAKMTQFSKSKNLKRSKSGPIYDFMTELAKKSVLHFTNQQLNTKHRCWLSKKNMP